MKVNGIIIKQAKEIHYSELLPDLPSHSFEQRIRHIIIIDHEDLVSRSEG